MIANATTQRFEISLEDAEYPELLAQSPYAPRRLYGIGDPSTLGPGLAVVGARKATPYGLRATANLAGWAASAGYRVISGGAIGCDQAAHRAALEHGGVCVAVLAGGPDVAYPRSAEELLRSVAATGAVVSEHPWGTMPQRWTFRTRNRIIAGLSVAVLVAEAALGSGTFSTAEYAADAGRDVLAVPGSIFAPECAGANRLIRQGAIPVTEPDDLRCALEPVLGVAARPPETLWSEHVATDPLTAALRTNPARPDDLARALGWDIITVTRRLGLLEGEGTAVRYVDGRYGLAK